MKQARTPSARLARHVAGIAVGAPQVIAARSLRMALAGAKPNGRDRREFALMHAEKIEAMQEAWIAMGVEAWRMQQQALFSMATAFLPGTGSPKKVRGPAGAIELVLKGIAPVHRRVAANVKRLRAAR